MPRSRIEADLIKTFPGWEYEPRDEVVKYTIEYHPDFRTPRGHILEIKGQLDTADAAKILKVNALIKKYVLCPFVNPSQMKLVKYAHTYGDIQGTRRGIQIYTWAILNNIRCVPWNWENLDGLVEL